ncbi:MAG: glutamate racemase [Muribaculaceae bacterium]|nr:glutamate racemase [Muribaculaceae bacterium]
MLPRGPIGVFDSGFGGLSVLKELQRALPAADFLYLGDNARAPYGTRSFDTVYTYTLQAVRWLFDHDCPLVIIACNTASAKALRSIQQRDLPHIAPERRVLGVIRPTAEAVGQLSSSGVVGLLGTPGTVASGSYDIEVAKLHPGFRVVAEAAPMWVPIVEQGFAASDGADWFVAEAVDRLLARDPDIDTIILGCTHYPLLYHKIRAAVPESINLVCQGHIVAASLLDYLQRHRDIDAAISRGGNTLYCTTDDAEAFAARASVFLDRHIEARTISLQ